MVLLLTVAGSMSPVNGTVIRGCVEKPSSVLITSMSGTVADAHAAVGLGQVTRRKVLLVQSNTVKRSLGNGPRPDRRDPIAR